MQQQPQYTTTVLMLSVTDKIPPPTLRILNHPTFVLNRTRRLTRSGSKPSLLCLYNNGFDLALRRTALRKPPNASYKADGCLKPLRWWSVPLPIHTHTHTHTHTERCSLAEGKAATGCVGWGRTDGRTCRPVSASLKQDKLTVK